MKVDFIALGHKRLHLTTSPGGLPAGQPAGGAGGIRIKAISAQLGLELGLGLSLAIQYLFLLKRDH